jgi:hypothetical protein
LKNFIKGNIIYVLLLTNSFSTPLNSQVAARFDVVITEIYAAPSSRSALPVSEFIELKNVSLSPVNLKGWRVTDGSSTAIISASFLLKPDSFLIISSTGATISFLPYGTVIGVTNFPSLNNDADNISLISPELQTIHAVSYETSWYDNAIKMDGGWSLEMIDTRNPCSGMSNWSASSNPTGGTPGAVNSVDAINPDNQPPALLRTYAKDSLSIIAIFDEPLDSVSAANVIYYKVSKGLQTVSALPLTPFFKQVLLTFKTPMQEGTVNELVVTHVKDCAGNTVGTVNSAKFGTNSKPVPGDVVINEMLFNPLGAGYDYLELYNNSNKILDTRKIFVSSRNSTGNLSNPTAVSDKELVLFPGGFRLITQNSVWLTQQYTVQDHASISQVSAMPSMPDDKGYIVITDEQGNVLDEISYQEKWHFPLINNKDGVSLERIDYNQPTQEKTNWTSASSQSGFGTPGYQNSQFRADLQAKAACIVEPKVFSPDNDGHNDVAGIHYQMAEPGYMGSIIIFDAAGRPVRYLAKNALLGMNGVINWDGLGENSNKLPVGIYVVFMEIFNLQGKSKRFKQTLTLARKF